MICLLLACMLPFSAAAEGVLVSVGLSEGQVLVNGRTVKSAGVVKRAPWGIHEADLIYENLLFQTGQTRLACWFGDVFPQAAGPVRSARLKLADETRIVLKNGLKLIGVDAPEKM